jgi:hypothetical protein
LRVMPFTRESMGINAGIVKDADGKPLTLPLSWAHAHALVTAANALPGLVEAVREHPKDSECYCADYIACKAPCGYCKLQAALKAAGEGGV